MLLRKGRKQLYKLAGIFLAVILVAVLIFQTFTGIFAYRYENTFTPIPDSFDDMEMNHYGCVLYAFDVNDKKKMVGFCDYVFVAKIENVTGTKYTDVSFRWDGFGFTGTPHTYYEISVLENIKGSLVTDRVIPVSEWGGIKIGNKGYEVHLPFSAGDYYIFLCNAQQDGSLSITDSAYLGSTADYSAETVDAYKQYYINQDESERLNISYKSVYEEHNAEFLLEKSDSLGDFANSISASDSYINGYFAVDDFVYFKQEGKEDVIYSIGYEGWMLPAKLIDECSDIKSEIRNSEATEMLCFDIHAFSQKGLFCLSSDGYLYISFGSVTKAFKIGTDKYNEFVKDFEGVSCVWTEENPVTIG